MRRGIFILIVLMGMQVNAFAQQDPVYSQYMFNGLVLNPAYAGSRDVASATMISRFQWAGVGEAPKTYSLGIHAPTPDQHHGIGVTLTHDRAFVIRNSVLSLNYAYRIKMGKAHLALGLRGGFQYYTAAMGDVPVKDGGDPAFEGNYVQRLIPTAGCGAYFHSEKFYAGVSSPNFLKGRLYSFPLYDLSYAERKTHLYLTSGAVFSAGDDFKIRPSFLMYYVRNAPIGVDLNVSAIFRDQFTAGLSWRLNNAIAFLAEFQVNEQLRIGYSYDLGISGIAARTAGSHEIRLGIDFGFKKYNMFSPRLYF